MKIGLVGEAPHDTNCISVLLNQIYNDVLFFPLINHIRGSQLDQLQPTKRLLRLEYQYEKPDLVIFIRDLDGLINEQEKIRLRKEYFAEYRRVVDGKAIFLLNIYELEALIFSDIDKFNHLYKCNIPQHHDPSSIPDPKGELKLKSKGRYSETHNLRIFETLDIQTVAANCSYFNQFLNNLQNHLDIN